MKFENTQVMNFKGALKGMRNPLESWHKSDSHFGINGNSYGDYDEWIFEVARNWTEQEIDKNIFEEFYSERKHLDQIYKIDNKYVKWLEKNGILQEDKDSGDVEIAFIGPNDMNLAQRLIKAGSEHRKFMRQIFVSVDITAPLYWWKECDQYRINVTTNSTSTMHKLTSRPITLDCFEMDDYNPITMPLDKDININIFEKIIIPYCEQLRQEYLKTKDKKYWKELIRVLPESWLQTRTWTCNYENLLNICKQRKGHKLQEWNSFIAWVKTLPYANEFIWNEKIDV